MNQMCKVCGEPAAGFHFGAFTCEGCKSFFGRTYNNLSSIADCKANGECVINKKNRTACKACRLRKCLVVGMSKSGSRYGRRSNWFKIHCLLQEQQHQRKVSDSVTGSAASSADSANGSGGGGGGGGVGSGSGALPPHLLGAVGAVGATTGERAASVPALNYIHQQYQQQFLKSESCGPADGHDSHQPHISRSNGLASLSTAAATTIGMATMFNHLDNPHSNHHRQLHHLHQAEHLMHNRVQQQQQQYSPASDSGASSAGDADEAGSSNGGGAGSAGKRDGYASDEMHCTGDTMKSTAKVKHELSTHATDASHLMLNALPPPTALSPPHSRTSNHLYEEFRTRYGVFLNEYRNATTASTIRISHGVQHPQIVVAASVATAPMVNDQLLHHHHHPKHHPHHHQHLQSDQSEPIDLTLNKRRKNGVLPGEEGEFSPILSPSNSPTPPAEARLSDEPPQKMKPTPLDLTLMRTDAG